MGDHPTRTPWPSTTDIDFTETMYNIPKVIETGDELIFHGIFNDVDFNNYGYVKFEILFESGHHVPDHNNVPLKLYYFHSTTADHFVTVSAKFVKKGVYRLTSGPELDSTPYYDGPDFEIKFQFHEENVSVYMKNLLIHTLPLEHKKSEIRYFTVCGGIIKKITKITCNFGESLPAAENTDSDNQKR